MEARGAVCLSLWTSLGLLLFSGAAGTASVSYTFAVNGTAQLDVPSCHASATDIVEWKSGNVRLVKGKLSDALKSKLDPKCNCQIMHNGALHLQRLEGEGNYKVEVHNDKGQLRCSGSVSAKTQHPVEQPFMNYTCTGKKRAEVRCFISRGSVPEFHLKQDDKIPQKKKSMIISGWSNQSTSVTCTASNNVSQSSISIIIICEGDVVDWYIYLAAGAGGVAFLIFVVLIVYSVRTCRRPKRERAEETMYCNNRRQVIQERQLPQPPVQASAPPPSYYNTDETEDVSSERPPTQRQEAPEAAPKGKKARRTRPRPPEPPNGQPESVLLNPQGPAPQQTKPALPGNHPMGQAPKPTPRTKSKPPRQNRKSR